MAEIFLLHGNTSQSRQSLTKRWKEPHETICNQPVRVQIMIEDK